MQIPLAVRNEAPNGMWQEKSYKISLRVKAPSQSHPPKAPSISMMRVAIAIRLVIIQLVYDRILTTQTKNTA